MNYIPLIRASIIDRFIFFEHYNTSVERYLTEVKLPPLKAEQSETLLSVKHVFKFYDGVAQVEGIDSLGFLVRQITQIEDFGAFGQLLRYSVTLHEAIQTNIHIIATYNCVNDG